MINLFKILYMPFGSDIESRISKEHKESATQQRLAVLYLLVSLALPISLCAQDTVHSDGFEDRLACQATESGGSNQVTEPSLIATLYDDWQDAWLGSPAIVDLNNDQVPEILVTRHNKVVGWHLDNSIVYSESTDARIWASPVVADFDPDIPGLEVAVASGSKIYMWNASGQVMDGFPVSWQSEQRSLAAGDIDGNGDLELVVVSTTPLEADGKRDNIFAVSHQGVVAPGFPPNTSGSSGCDANCYIFGGYDQNIALGNVDDDAGLELFASQDLPYLSLHKGNGLAFDANAMFQLPSKFPGVRFLHDYAEAKQGWAPNEETSNQSQFTNSAPVIADIDDDGKGELVVLGWVSNSAQTDRERGVALWVIKPDGSRPANWEQPFHVSEYLAGLYGFGGTNLVAATNQVSAANINPYRKGPEFVFAGFDGRIHAVDSAANQLWQYAYTTDDRVLTGGEIVAA